MRTFFRSWFPAHRFLAESEGKRPTAPVRRSLFNVQPWLLFLGVGLLSSCSILNDGLGPVSCEGDEGRCDGNTLLVCRGGVFVQAPCGDRVCDPENLVCSLCGDGLVSASAGEQCDDGNTTNADGCSDVCLIDTCGNNILNTGEQCDDGNTTNGDGCAGDCSHVEICGDGFLDFNDQNNNGLPDVGEGELCDDGDNLSGDGCRSDCLKAEICGDGILDAGEECDDNNTNNADGCQGDCFLPACQDGVVDPGELCLFTVENLNIGNPSTLGLGDFDDDQDLDLVASIANEINVFSNPGDGSFVGLNPFATNLGANQPIHLTFGSVGEDGQDDDLDIITSNFTNNSASVLQNDGDNTFTSADVSLGAGNIAMQSALGDRDGDGDVDLFVARRNSGVEIFENDGAGVFTPAPGGSIAVGTFTFGIAAADLDDDGLADIAAVDRSNIVVLLLTASANKTISLPINFNNTDASSSIAFADVNNDQVLEAFVSVGSQNAVVLISSLLENESFDVIPTANNPVFVAAADADQDGFQDLVVAAKNGNVAEIFLNDRLGVFGVPFTFSATAPNAVAVGDVNDDGAIDLAISGTGGVTLLTSAP